MKTYLRESFESPPDQLEDLHRYFVEVVYDPDRVTQDTIQSDVYLSKRHVSRYSGVGIEGFHKLRDSGVLLPHTPYQSYSYDLEAVLGDREMMLVSGTNGEDLESRLYAPNDYTIGLSISALHGRITEIDEPLLSSFMTDYGDELVQAAAANIYSKGFDVSTFVAELTDLRKMYWGLLDDVSDIRRTIRRKLVRKDSWGRIDPYKVVKYMGDAWLELRYGWRPLMYELIEFQEVMNSFDEKRRRWSERVGTTKRWTDTDTVVSESTGFEYFCDTTTSWEVSSRGAVTADVSPEKFRDNIAETTWEKVPYSFVVDWFLSVAQAIQARSLLLIAEATVASSGVQVTAERNIVGGVRNFQDISPSNYWVSINTPGSKCDIKAVLKKREPTSVSTRPFSRVNIDDFKAVDLVALANQILVGETKGGHW